MSSKLETTANLIVIGAGLLVIATVSANWLAGRRELPRPKPIRYVAGDTVPVSGTLDYDQADRNLVLFFNTRCSFCVSSVGFYRRLSTLAAGSDAGVQFFVVTSEEPASVERYLEEQQVFASKVVGIRDSGLRLDATPSLVLIDRRRRVAANWVGQLSEGEEAAAVKLAGG